MHNIIQSVAMLIFKMKKADIILIAIVFAVVGVILFFLYGVNMA